MASADFASRDHFSFFIEPPIIEYAQIPDYQARRTVESAFELTRAASFLELPARRVAIFCSLSEEEVKRWIAPEKSRTGANVYEVQIVDDSTVLVVDLSWFDYSVRLAKNLVPSDRRILGHSFAEDEIRSASCEYWSGSKFSDYGGSTHLEALVDGSVRVVGLVRSRK